MYQRLFRTNNPNICKYTVHRLYGLSTLYHTLDHVKVPTGWIHCWMSDRPPGCCIRVLLGFCQLLPLAKSHAVGSSHWTALKSRIKALIDCRFAAVQYWEVLKLQWVDGSWILYSALRCFMNKVLNYFRHSQLLPLGPDQPLASLPGISSHPVAVISHIRDEHMGTHCINTAVNTAVHSMSLIHADTI